MAEGKDFKVTLRTVADTSGAKETGASLEQVKKQAEGVGDAVEGIGKNQGLPQAKEAAKDLGEAAKETAEEVEQVEQAVQDVAEAADDLGGSQGLPKTERGLEEISQAAEEAARDVKHIEDALEDVGAAADQTGDRAVKAGERLADAGGRGRSSWRGVADMLKGQVTIGIDQVIDMAWKAGTAFGEWIFRPTDWDQLQKDIDESAKKIAKIRDATREVREEFDGYLDALRRSNDLYDEQIAKINHISRLRDEAAGRQAKIDAAKDDLTKAEIGTRGDLPESEKAALKNEVDKAARDRVYDAEQADRTRDEEAARQAYKAADAERSRQQEAVAEADRRVKAAEEVDALKAARAEPARRRLEEANKLAGNPNDAEAQRTFNAAQEKVRELNDKIAKASEGFEALGDVATEAKKGAEVAKEANERIQKMEQMMEQKLAEVERIREDRDAASRVKVIQDKTYAIQDEAEVGILRQKEQERAQKAQETQEKAEKKAGEGQEKEAAKALKGAEKEADKAQGAVDDQAKELQDKLGKMADLARGHNDQTAAVLDNLARSLEDGLQPGELERISAAMDNLVGSVNQGFASLAQATVAGAQSAAAASAQASQALAEVQRLRAQVQSLKR